VDVVIPQYTAVNAVASQRYRIVIELVSTHTTDTRLSPLANIRAKRDLWQVNQTQDLLGQNM